jgi:hypothetical protein
MKVYGGDSLPSSVANSKKHARGRTFADHFCTNGLMAKSADGGTSEAQGVNATGPHARPQRQRFRRQWYSLESRAVLVLCSAFGLSCIFHGASAPPWDSGATWSTSKPLGTRL